MRFRLLSAAGGPVLDAIGFLHATNKLACYRGSTGPLDLRAGVPSEVLIVFDQPDAAACVMPATIANMKVVLSAPVQTDGLQEWAVRYELPALMAGPAGQRTISVARPRKRPMLATSVAVVRKMLDAVAGSAPKRLQGERDERAGQAAHQAAADHGQEHDEAQQERRRVPLRARDDVHADAPPTRRRGRR